MTAGVSSIAGPVRVAAQESGLAPADAAEGEPPPSGRPDDTNSRDQERKLTAAFLIVAVIAVVGIVLVVLVALWGFRIRRMARSGSSKRTEVDGLWYLRPNKEIGSVDSHNDSNGEPNPNETNTT